MSGSGRSDVKRLKRVGDNMEPCGTPFFRYIVREVLPFRDTWAVLPEMRFASHFFKLGWRFVFSIFWMSMRLGTVSNALSMSIAVSIVFCGGGGLI